MSRLALLVLAAGIGCGEDAVMTGADAAAPGDPDADTPGTATMTATARSGSVRGRR